MASSSKLSPEAGMFQFFTDEEYRSDLNSRVRDAKAGARILLMSMSFDPSEGPIGDLMDSAIDAASRGVQVILGIDAHCFLLHKGALGPLWYSSALPDKLDPEYQQKKDVLDQINAFPTGQAAIINQPAHRFSIPIAGRSHIKAAIVNDYIYLGGCNLEGSYRADMMVGIQDRETADKLYDVLHFVVQSGSTDTALKGLDQILTIDSRSKLLIDSGERNQSLILETALQLIDESDESIFMTNQYFPNSITAEHFNEANKRGVDVDIVFSHPRYQGFIGGLGQHASIFRERTRLPDELFEEALGRNDPMVHAKLLASEKAFMIGSHNYINAGVTLGTAEIALQCSDPALATQAVKTFLRSLAAKRLYS